MREKICPDCNGLGWVCIYPERTYKCNTNCYGCGNKELCFYCNGNGKISNNSPN